MDTSLYVELDLNDLYCCILRDNLASLHLEAAQSLVVAEEAGPSIQGIHAVLIVQRSDRTLIRQRMKDGAGRSLF